MNTKLVLGLLFAGSLLAANAAPKDDVTSAAKKLGSSNYSWKTTSSMTGGPGGGGGGPGGGGQGGPGGGQGGQQGGPGGGEGGGPGGGGPGGPGGGNYEGKADASGIAVVTMTMRESAVEIVKKGDKVVYKGESGWQVADTANMEQGPGGMIVMMASSLAVPAVQALELATKASSLTLAGDVYSADLPEDVAKTVAMPFRGGPGGEGPTVSGAKASVKFWVANGVLTKYELTTSAKINFGGNEDTIGTTNTVEIKDVGTTTVTVPAEAKAKL